MVHIPIYEYLCPHCNKITEDYTTKADGGVDNRVCKYCGCLAKKVPSAFRHRMDGKLTTEGGPVWQDQQDDIGPITGDMQEESSKAYRDHQQAKREGRELDNVFGE
jgi:hypothetical protein